MTSYRPSRVLAVLIVAATLVAGCQCAAPPPTGQAIRPFAGNWHARASDLYVASDGRISVDMQDTSTSPFGYLILHMTATSVDGKTLRAKVVKSDSKRVPIGSVYTFKPTSDGLSMTGPVSKEWCSPEKFPTRPCGGFGGR